MPGDPIARSWTDTLEQMAALFSRRANCSCLNPLPDASLPCDLQPGDLVIAASDGVWDNARDEEVLACVKRGADDAQQVSDLPWNLSCEVCSGVGLLPSLAGRQ